ncbi:MAG: hypothetical protein U1E15_12545 [Hyphomicrobiales bacterium]
MTNFFTSTTATAAFAASLIGGLVMASGESQASASSAIFKCHANSKDKVIECCQRIVQQRGRPNWMITSEADCSSAASCSTKKVSITSSYFAANIPPKKVVKCGYTLPGNGNGGAKSGGGEKGGDQQTYYKP